jgi:hypothetical protein
MGLRIDSVENACSLIARQVQDVYGDLTMHFIVHGKGQMNERIALSEHEVIRHPAGDTARSILRKIPKTDHSSFLGMAVALQKKLFGLSSKDHVLALFNINIDTYTDISEAKTHIYHLAWHAIDLMDIRKRPEYRRKFKSGPMIPKRSPMNLARANLQADAFAAVMQGLNGDAEALDLLAVLRGHNALIQMSEQRAEDFPYIIALEAAQFAYSELERNKIARSKYIETARHISLEVGYTFDEASIKQWWAFSEPSQDMAWRGYKPEEILGAAVFTSENPYVRATAYLVSEVTNIEPLPSHDITHAYNPFANQEKNKLLHREIMQATFEEAINLGNEEESARALLDAANSQNENLTEGRILGWCASALQAAAKAFQNAMDNGGSPLEAAQQEFDGAKAKLDWDTIKKLGDDIVSQRRQGYTVTMGNIAEICNENPAFAPILGSIKMTLNDPVYLQRLQASNDLGLNRRHRHRKVPHRKGRPPKAPRHRPQHRKRRPPGPPDRHRAVAVPPSARARHRAWDQTKASLSANACSSSVSNNKIRTIIKTTVATKPPRIKRFSLHENEKAAIASGLFNCVVRQTGYETIFQLPSGCWQAVP